MNIKEQIQKKGFTISQVASLMTNKKGEKGISQSSLSQIINGNPTIDKLQEIAGIIGTSLPELVSDNNSVVRGVKCPNCGQEFEIEFKKIIKDM